MAFTVVTRCRCCGSSDLRPILDLGRQPLANSYVREPTDLPLFPLVLQVCEGCYHNQLSVAVAPDLMFREYLYVSGTSPTFRAHFVDLAREAIAWIEPRPRRVLDLACNDGTLLEAFSAEGCAVQGVDPASNLVILARQKGLEVIEGYWPEASPDVHGTFDVITATNVLAHVPDPQLFLEAALSRLTPHGAVIVEVPYCREMILRSLWDTIYHEHLSYFLMSPLLRLVERLDAAVTFLRAVSSHGGSLRLGIQRTRQGHCSNALAFAAAERRDGLQDFATHQAFAERVALNSRVLGELVRSLVVMGKRVIGYGASAKGNTLLNHCQFSLAYVVDDNPLKQGYLTPGREIPIRPVAHLRQEEPGLEIVLLAWNFAREILQNLRSLRPGHDDHVIHYVPRVHRHSVEEDSPEPN